MRTLRGRVTIVASIAITVAVVLGFVLLYLLQIHALRSTINSQLRTYAAQIEQSASAGRWATPLPQSSLDGSAMTQVLNPGGNVLAASRSLVGLPAVYRLPAGSTTPVRQTAADGAVPSELQVVATRTIVKGQPVTIITATSTGLIAQLDTEFATRLLIGIPVVLLLAGVAVWLIIGRALRPVERIRRAVTEITSADLTQRVPEPGSADEIGQLAATMNDMLGRLDDAAQRQRRFVADASHELRTPIAGIRTSVEVGLAYPDRAPWPDIAERVAQQSTRLEQLIAQLLTLAKADDRQLAARQQPLNLAELLTDVRSDLPAHNVTIDLDVPGDLSTTGDPADLRRLFRNIVDNAIRYASTGVSIDAYAHTQQVVVQIDDDGPGIPVADRSRVFDRFVRLDTSRERGSGTTGLGLAIAREIATAHHAQIVITDHPTGGTRVTVSLPERPRQS